MAPTTRKRQRTFLATSFQDLPCHRVIASFLSLHTLLSMEAVAQWTKEIHSAEVTVLSHLGKSARPPFDELRLSSSDNTANTQFWWRDEHAKVLSRLLVRMPNLVTVGYAVPIQLCLISSTVP